MPEINLNHTFGLLQEANTRGIKLYLDKNELIVKFPKSRGVDQAFLEKLRENKYSLIEYFKSESESTTVNPKKKIHKKDPYCIVPPVYHWWLDENSDNDIKQNIYMLLAYKIEGNFSVSNFRKSLSFLTGRHESLRATFHKAGQNAYKMIPLKRDDPALELDYRDLGELRLQNDAAVNNLFLFKDHHFDLQKGPLFLVRLIKIREGEFLLSGKIHHMIYDAWSIEILLRDLFCAFRAYAENKEPDLSELKFQYSDYMSFLNQYNHKHKKTDRDYWISTNKTCAEELTIPGQKRRLNKSSVNICHSHIFTLPSRANETISYFAEKYSQSVFIILQASLKLYLHKITGRRDIVISTMVFDRDQLKGSEDQIGLYSKMYIIRTIIEENEPFETCVKKVSKANSDMISYRAYSLFSTMMELMKKKKQTFHLFRRLTVYYSDSSGYVSKSYMGTASPAFPFTISSVPTAMREVYSHIDLFFNFFKKGDSMDLKVTYAADLFDLETIKNLVEEYFNFLVAIPR